MSTAQLMIKSATPSPALPGVGQFLQSAGLTVSPNDAYAVDAYMTSRDAVKDLEKNNDIRSIYNRPEGDFIAFYAFGQIALPHSLGYIYLGWFYHIWFVACFFYWWFTQMANPASPIPTTCLSDAFSLRRPLDITICFFRPQTPQK
jgi:hypothetical protein